MDLRHQKSQKSDPVTIAWPRGVLVPPSWAEFRTRTLPRTTSGLIDFGSPWNSVLSHFFCQSRSREIKIRVPDFQFLFFLFGVVADPLNSLRTKIWAPSSIRSCCNSGSCEYAGKEDPRPSAKKGSFPPTNFPEDVLLSKCIDRCSKIVHTTTFSGVLVLG